MKIHLKVATYIVTLYATIALLLHFVPAGAGTANLPAIILSKCIDLYDARSYFESGDKIYCINVKTATINILEDTKIHK